MPTIDPLPLADKRIVVTRAVEQARDLVEQLEALGARVSILPLVRFAEPLDWGELDRALDSLSEYDWLFFTSQNAVDCFSRRCHERGVAPSGITPKIAAVGPITAEAARRDGFQVAHVAKQFRGAVLAGDLEGEIRHKRILLPRSDRANEDLPRQLRARGAIVAEVIAYRTLGPDSADVAAIKSIQTGKVDVVVFYSPSAFHHLLDLVDLSHLQSLVGKVCFAAIGPMTAQAIREAGLPVPIQAEEATTLALVEALVQYCAQHSPTGERAK